MNIDDFSALREKSEPSQRLKPSQLVFHFCVFAVALLANCAGCILVSDLMIPLYLDSILTIMVTATSGLGAGLMCAVLSNGILTIFDYTMLPFVSCHILTAFLSSSFPVSPHSGWPPSKPSYFLISIISRSLSKESSHSIDFSFSSGENVQVEYSIIPPGLSIKIAYFNISL